MYQQRRRGGRIIKRLSSTLSTRMHCHWRRPAQLARRRPVHPPNLLLHALATRCHVEPPAGAAPHRTRVEAPPAAHVDQLLLQVARLVRAPRAHVGGTRVTVLESRRCCGGRVGRRTHANTEPAIPEQVGLVNRMRRLRSPAALLLLWLGDGLPLAHKTLVPASRVAPGDADGRALAAAERVDAIGAVFQRHLGLVRGGVAPAVAPATWRGRRVPTRRGDRSYLRTACVLKYSPPCPRGEVISLPRLIITFTRVKLKVPLRAVHVARDDAAR